MCQSTSSIVIAVSGGGSDDTRDLATDTDRRVDTTSVPPTTTTTLVSGPDLIVPPKSAEATAATGRFDIVDVFRRPEECAVHAREAVAAGAGCLWLQLGVVNWEAARIATDGGLSVVMDRCTAIEHPRLI